MLQRKKLIEVALPLEAINKESAREKSIRHGHPSTLHLWWARRPLAACRAVLFASLVDDPSSRPEEFPTEEAQERERLRLFRIIEELVKWENVNNERVLDAARVEILKSTNGNPPPVYDPFCGGGSIPLEAQRLGLEAHASDLNPVAVLITKALIEIPPKFKDMPPINPEARQKLKVNQWKGAQGLAEDVRYYGKWMRDEAEKRIGHLYPNVKLPQGGEATVIAWLWARTVKCPNPACGCQMPLVRSFALSTKKGKETWVEPIVERANHESTKDNELSELRASMVPQIRFEIRRGQGKPLEGTVSRKGAVCIACATPVPLGYVRSEGKAGRMGAQMMAIVAEGQGGRIYLPSSQEHETVAKSAQPGWKPETELPCKSGVINPPLYGLIRHSDLFTPRQLTTLTTFSKLVYEAREQLLKEKVAEDYANAVVIYLGLGVSKLSDALSSLTRWKPSMDQAIATFARQAFPMVWDYAESSTFNKAAGDYATTINTMARAISNLNSGNNADCKQADAKEFSYVAESPLISTDPPYYNAVPYADLSDFFYVWLRQALGNIFPEDFTTLLAPKNQELVADPFRHGNREKAKEFFEEGLGKAFSRVRQVANPDYPFTVYYAFKQTETDDEDEESNGNLLNIASTGWETMLTGLIHAGFSITGTLPMRTELSNRTRATSSNALASSIVLVCRSRPENAPQATRRQFLNELKRELPDALKKLQQGNIAPVDLAQASIGPGMAIFSRYAKVLESDGSPMRVRTALQLINQTLDEFLSEQEGEFDGDSRWAIAWFEQHQFNEGLYGDAETLSKAKNTAVQGMVNAGILMAKGGKVRLLHRDELPDNWDPSDDDRVPDWEATQHLIRALDQHGETGAANLLAKLGDRGEVAKDLAYRLYSICERKGWAQEAVAYNSLVISYPEISRLASEQQQSIPTQGNLF